MNICREQLGTLQVSDHHAGKLRSVAILDSGHRGWTIQPKMGGDRFVVTCRNDSMAKHALAFHLGRKRGQRLPQHAITIRRLTLLLQRVQQAILTMQVARKHGKNPRHTLYAVPTTRLTLNVGAKSYKPSSNPTNAWDPKPIVRHSPHRKHATILSHCGTGRSHLAVLLNGFQLVQIHQLSELSSLCKRFQLRMEEQRKSYTTMEAVKQHKVTLVKAPGVGIAGWSKTSGVLTNFSRMSHLIQDGNNS